MNLSLNEVRAMARKAARGAGYDWALADEAGWACGALCEAGIDGVAALAGLLEAGGADCVGGLEVSDAVWRRGSGQICPVYAGTVLCDRRALSARVLALDGVVSPIMLLPYIRAALRGGKGPVIVTCERGRANIDAQSIYIMKDFSEVPVRVDITATEDIPPHRHASSRASPDPAAWDVLTTYAHRTYAPATEASRLRGAGGDLPDTD
ncbi:MAG: DUF3726 domain-containing protein [Pseudomonadota bacterium]